MNQNVSDVQKPIIHPPMKERRRYQRESSTDLIDDRMTPTLFSLIVFETLRWGGIALVLFVVYRFFEPKVISFYNQVLAPQDEMTLYETGNQPQVQVEQPEQID